MVSMFSYQFGFKSLLTVHSQLGDGTQVTVNVPVQEIVILIMSINPSDLPDPTKDIMTTK